MKDFPEFMRNRKNAIDEASQSRGIEGYVFDGVDGSQMIHWTCNIEGKSEEHVHDFDEYFVVVQGVYTLLIKGKRIRVSAGQEYYISKGTPHAGEFVTGTRTIHAFGGARAKRK